jgi:hypothetical protein
MRPEGAEPLIREISSSTSSRHEDVDQSAHELGIFCVLGLDPLILRLPSGGVLRRLYFLKKLRKREAPGP